VLGKGDGTFPALLPVVEGFGPVSITVGDFNGDGRQDLATGNAAGHDARSVFILINIGMGVSDLVTFDPIPSTFTFTPDPTGCPEGFVGTFHFEARLTNSRARSLLTLVVQVITLTQGNLLQNADGGPGGVSTGLTVPQQDGFTDGVLSPDESVDVPFIICLTQQRRFTLVVDVFGEVE
jgi:hypothetical protein